MSRPANSRFEVERDNHLIALGISRPDNETGSETSKQTSTGDRQNNNDQGSDIQSDSRNETTT
jgi:hypothetical protein